MTGTMRNIRECLKISCKCDAHFAESLFQTRIKQSEGFYKMLYKENYEDKIYSLDKTVPGQTQDLSLAIQKTLEIMAG